MEALRVDRTVLIDGDALSVSFTRDLEHYGPEAARHAPTHVELRLDLRHCDALTEAQKSAITSAPEMQATRRGIVRVICREYRTRSQNLAGARQALVKKLRTVLFPRPDDERARAQDLEAAAAAAAEAQPKKRSGGLIKRNPAPDGNST